MQKTNWWQDCLFLILVLGSLFFILLGSRPLFVPDEGRYAEIAREMAVSNDFITPYLNGIRYFEKPVLYYWLGAIAFKLGGVNVWSIRCINALLGLLGCLSTYFTARTLYNRRTGLWAALILGTSLLYFVMAHMVSLDLPVTVFLACSLYAFILGTQEPSPAKCKGYFYLAAMAAALAVLTKGLIGILLPLIIISTWLTLMGKWRLCKQLHLPICVLIFLLISLPWHIIVQLRHPEFFYFYFIEQHILRYTDLSIGHYEPVWFFIPYLLAGFLPWIIFLPSAIKLSLPPTWKQRQHFATPLFFVLWASLIFLFFSFSKSKLIPYILPIFPALAILTARVVVTISRKITIPMLVITWLTLLLTLPIMPRLDTRTIKPLAEQLKTVLQPSDIVITYNQYYQDLPFYLQRRVSILNWKNELSYGMQHQDTHEWMLDDHAFWTHWHSKKRIFVIISQSEYKKLRQSRPNETFYLLGETSNNVLISNRAGK